MYTVIEKQKRYFNFRKAKKERNIDMLIVLTNEMQYWFSVLKDLLEILSSYLCVVYGIYAPDRQDENFLA